MATFREVETEETGIADPTLGSEGDESILQLVAVHIGEEIYAFGISCINSIIMPQAITRVPRTPPYVLGVMNLRGRIVPIVDLRKRFGLPPASQEMLHYQRIVIVEVDGITAGLVVDAVTEVLRMAANRIEPPSLLVVTAEAECITGIGRTDDDRLLILLDVYRTLTMKPSEENALRSLQSAAPAEADASSTKTPAASKPLTAPAKRAA
jgi:purine-binding chemotaxis protein CheW